MSADCLTSELTCAPLDSYDEIFTFLDDPPDWRTLCIELKQHSEYAVINAEISDIDSQKPQMFCHSPDSEEGDFDVLRQRENELPKTLVCHDMANGYHDDSFIDGTGNYDAYNFYNWAGINIFCYFSHHFITIPPLGWINVGHMHGVKVIGTIITEWADGEAIWERILQSPQEWRKFACGLVAIAKCLRFDGWLLNIENKISKPQELLRFVKYFHKMLHDEIPCSVLIWYDSVTVDGHLIWQNGLNDKNRAFFDVTDGIFTNYSWSEEDVASSAAAAGDRLHDLYVGMDVWGRNFHGGGKFNTVQAVKLAHKHGCSLAIFAPAWTHEAIPTVASQQDSIASTGGAVTLADCPATMYDKFLLRDRALWDSLWPYLNTKLPCALPFRTSFCRGQGKKRRLYGEVLSPGPWYNLRHMQYQPNSANGPHGYMVIPKEKSLALSQHILKNASSITLYGESIPTYKRRHSATTTSETEVNDISLNDIGDVKRSFGGQKYTPEHSKEIQSSISIKPYSSNDSQFNLDYSNYSKSDSNVTKEDNRINKEVNVGTEERLSKFVAAPVALCETNKDEISKAIAVSSDGSSQNTQYDVERELKELGLIPVPEEKQCFELYMDDAFIGGSCLKVHPSDDTSDEHRVSRLFHCDFVYEDSLIISVVTKNVSKNDEQYLNVVLEIVNSKKKNKILLIGRDVCTPELREELAINLFPVTGGDLKQLQRYILLEEPNFYVPVENSYGWNVRYYVLDGRDCETTGRVCSIWCRTGEPRGSILLGHIGLCSRITNML